MAEFWFSDQIRTPNSCLHLDKMICCFEPAYIVINCLDIISLILKVFKKLYNCRRIVSKIINNVLIVSDYFNFLRVNWGTTWADI